MGNKRLVALWASAILPLAATVRATEITGPHDNNSTGHGDGYDATSGAYDVPADTDGVPSATFNNNGDDGLYATGVSTSVTVEGGQFNSNFVSGIEAETGSTITITGGAFNDNGDEAVFAGYSSAATISGGQFVGNAYALVASSGAITLYGGEFGGSTSDDFTTVGDVVSNGVIVKGTLDVYGAFPGVPVGQTATLSANGPGSFYGQLEFNSTPQIYTYYNLNGVISLHATNTLVPEPGLFGLAALAGLGGPAGRARRRPAK